MTKIKAIIHLIFTKNYLLITLPENKCSKQIFNFSYNQLVRLSANLVSFHEDLAQAIKESREEEDK